MELYLANLYGNFAKRLLRIFGYFTCLALNLRFLTFAANASVKNVMHEHAEYAIPEPVCASFVLLLRLLFFEESF